MDAHQNHCKGGGEEKTQILVVCQRNLRLKSCLFSLRKSREKSFTSQMQKPFPQPEKLSFHFHMMLFT